ncbi:MAG TPA: EutN/CcmL family microcompartment protein [Planctomycetota bacterium]|jgi:microcompartment protein CcmK/EutM|nr:EutN/CcmL family microcompartment protein [Planctomycetota bacterium]
MQIGRVIGTVVATQKEEKMTGLKLLVVQLCDARGKPLDGYTVAVDAVGAGLREMVLVATGSSARQTKATEGRPTDATIMAIVDSWDVGGEIVWDKERE